MSAAQLREVVVAQVAAVEQDAPLGRVVEPREQLDDGRLAGAVLADQRQRPRRPADRQVEVAHRPVLGIRVAEADILERRCPTRIGRGNGSAFGRRRDRGPDLEEREQVVEIERLAGDLREAEEQAFEQAPQPQEGAGQEGQVADAELAAHGAPAMSA